MQKPHNLSQTQRRVEMQQVGFSLIELLVVIAIVGILAAVGTISYTSYTNTAKQKIAEVNFLNVVQYVETVGQLITSGLDSTGGLSGDVSTAQEIAQSIEDEMSGDINNPYQSDQDAVIAGGTLTVCADNAGKIMLYGTHEEDEIDVSTCYSEQSTVTFEAIEVK